MTYIDSPNGLMLPRSLNGNGGHDRGEAAIRDLYEATIRDLELQLAEDRWLRLSGDAEEFSRQTVGEIVASARAYYLKNPIVNRAVEISALYVWGQDLTHSAADANVEAVVDRFWALNQATLTGQQASRLLDVELDVTGNVFFALFPDRVTGDVRVRHVPIEHVQDVVTNPEDRAEPWYYRRTWPQRAADGTGSETRTAFHPDWKHTPKTKPASLAWNGQDVPIEWGVPIRHVKAGAFLHWLWGVPTIYPALDWAKAYKGMLEDDATRSASLARWAWSITANTPQEVASVKARLHSTLGAGTGYETNPPPAAGSVAIGKNKPEPIDISRAVLPVDHSRPIRLMTSAALGIPDHFFDSDVGNYATASTLDRPTELRFSERRRLWLDVYDGLIQFAIDADLMASRGLLDKSITGDRRKVTLSFPDLLARDTEKEIAGLVTFATLDGKEPAGTIPLETVARIGMTRYGIEDVDAELAKLEAEKIERERKAAEIARQTQPNPPENDEEEPNGEEPDGGQPAQESLDEAKAVAITDDDLAAATAWFDRAVPKAKGLLDAEPTEDEDAS